MKKITLLTLFIALTLFGKAQTTYSDIAPALYKNCTSCHRPGGGAPFSMLTYADTQPWTTAMLLALIDGDMPPWGADTSYMHFVNERPISQSDKDTIMQWIYDGSLEGNPALLPPPPVYPQYYLNGTPDTIVQMMSFYSNAGATDAYNTIVTPLTFAQSRYIRAIELIPSNPSLIHHSLIVADTAGDVLVDTTGSSFTVGGDISIGTWAPGSLPIVFPNSTQLKMGIELPANGEIAMQIHTPAGTAGQLINVELRLYLYPPNEPGIRPVYDFVPLQYWENDFWIAAGQIASFSTEQATYPFDISIFSSFPHSHQICTEILNYAYDTVTLDTIDLIKIDRWEFEHQEYYYFRNLVHIPPGYKYHSDHTFDNTAQNHHNPFSPPQLITVGPYSYDEMLFDGFQFVTYLPGDEFINIDSLLTNDPLLNYPVGIGEVSLGNKYGASSVFPNPVTVLGTIQFAIKLNNTSEYKLKLWSIDGKEVAINYTLKDGAIEFRKGNLKPNIYFYQVSEGNEKIAAGKIIIQ